jgi:hypothetical protein
VPLESNSGILVFTDRSPIITLECTSLSRLRLAPVRPCSCLVSLLFAPFLVRPEWRFAKPFQSFPTKTLWSHAPTLAPCLRALFSLLPFFLTQCRPIPQRFRILWEPDCSEKVPRVILPIFDLTHNYKQHQHIQMAKQKCLSLSNVPMDRTHVATEVVKYLRKRILHYEDAIVSIGLYQVTR